MIQIKAEEELKILNNKNVYVIEISLILNGYNVAINKNVEGPTGTIQSVQGYKGRIYKLPRILILTSHANYAGEKMSMEKVLGARSEREIRQQITVEDD